MITSWSRKFRKRIANHGKAWAKARLVVESLEARTLLSGVTPIMISQDGLGLEFIDSMAVSPTGADGLRRAYLGQGISQDDDRMNLAVVTLDTSGRPMGQPRFYPDAD